MTGGRPFRPVLVAATATSAQAPTHSGVGTVVGMSQVPPAATLGLPVHDAPIGVDELSAAMAGRGTPPFDSGGPNVVPAR
jgi:hypothetical protein